MGLRIPPTTRLHQALERAGLPVIGVGGNQAAPRVLYSRALTPGEQATANGLIAGHDWTPKRLRNVAALRQAILALTPAQRSSIWNDLTSGSPPRWTRQPGQHTPAMVALHGPATSVTLLPADVQDARVAMIVLHMTAHPRYLLDLGIAVDGLEADD